MPPSLTLVVPCFNEGKRLPVADFKDALARFPSLDLLFVDDGSTDDTEAVLARVRAGNESRVEVLRLAENRGKGEAVRAGILSALSRSPRPAFVGYFDADLSTPIEAAFDMVGVLEREPVLFSVLGSRLRTPGSAIRRRLLRHLPGRLIAWRISRTLGLPIHDTQCGAKVFRTTYPLPGLLSEPFSTRWLFDVEILARLVRLHRPGFLPAPMTLLREFPLPRWTDVPGSKVSFLDFFRSFPSLRFIRRYLASPSIDPLREPLACACCGYLTMVFPGGCDICDVCGWQQDSVCEDQPDEATGPNHVSLNQARENFRRIGASEEGHLGLVRPPLPGEIPPTT